MLYVCGERPGEDEVERGLPFVGRSGEWIDAGLGPARGASRGGLHPPFRKPPECAGCPLQHKGRGFVPGAAFGDRLWISNVRRCLADDETPDEKAASTAHCVRAYLEPELAQAEPKTLLLIGGDALAAVVGLTEMQRYHASVWHRAEIDEVRRALNVASPALPPTLHTVVTTMHPAFAMRVGLPQLKPSITLTTARARRWSERSEGPHRAWSFSLEPSPDDLIAYLDTDEPVAIDVETPRDDHRKIDIAGFGARPGHAMVVPWTEPFIEIARDFMGREGVWKIGHNFAFDRAAFAAYDIEVAPPVWDTIQAAALLNPPFREASKHRWLNLPTCAMRLLDGIFNWKDAERPAVRAMYRAAFPGVPEWQHARLYNGIDVAVTRLLKGAQEVVLREEGML